jgi:hypothetical protein
MKRLIVKPMPVRTLVPYSVIQLAPAGGVAQPARIANRAAPNTPICLPTNKPAAMPSGTGSMIEDGDRSEKDSPALAKPNKGRMPKATHGASSCSMRRSGEASPGPVLYGIANANAAPAKVACTPDFSTKTHSTTPSNTYQITR